jgi:hypothetical protein
MSATGGSFGEQPGDDVPLERFKPTTGAVAGWFGIGLAVVAIGYVVVAEHSLGGVRLALGAAFAAVLVWVSQIRPRATAYVGRIVLHGSISDTVVPYVAINQVTMGQTLNIWVGRKRYVCIGLGRAVGAEARQRMRARGSGDMLGLGRAARALGDPEPVADAAAAYHVFVLDRITELVRTARARADRADTGGDGAPRAEVERRPAVPEIAALAVTGLAFLLSLLL